MKFQSTGAGLCVGPIIWHSCSKIFLCALPSTQAPQGFPVCWWEQVVSNSVGLTPLILLNGPYLGQVGPLYAYKDQYSFWIPETDPLKSLEFSLSGFTVSCKLESLMSPGCPAPTSQLQVSVRLHTGLPSCALAQVLSQGSRLGQLYNSIIFPSLRNHGPFFALCPIFLLFFFFFYIAYPLSLSLSRDKISSCYSIWLKQKSQ